LFRPSDRICGRDEKEELHRGERHKRARIIDVPITHNNKNDEEIASHGRAHCCRVSDGRRGRMGVLLRSCRGVVSRSTGAGRAFVTVARRTLPTKTTTRDDVLAHHTV